VLRAFLATAAFLPMVIAHAPMAQAFGISTEQLSSVDQTCLEVLGLKRGETYFARCQESLSNALAVRNEGHAVAATYSDCKQRGLVDGTGAFSTCMLEDFTPASGAVERLAISSTGGAETEAGRSFYEVAPHVQWKRERYACAQLGLLPGSAPFGDCVASLQGAFLPDPN
jgi:hypothetical protein